MKTRYQIPAINASLFGGLYALSELLHQLKFEALFPSVFDDFRKVRKFKPSDNITLLLDRLSPQM